MAYTKGAPKPEGSGIKKGQKQFKTLEKEARRAVFDEKVSKKWLKLIDDLKPEYVADQFMGEAPKTLNIEVTSKVISVDE